MVTIEQLRKITLLSDLSDGELTQLSTILTERKARRGSFILYADDPGASLMFILKGRVKVTLTSNEGKEVVVANEEQGDFFGELALLTGGERSANVVALSDCDLLVLTAEDFQKHILQNSGLILAIARVLAFRLRAAAAKIGDLALYDVYRRVARTLRGLAEEEQREGTKHFIIKERPTHQELASMVGTSREMVTRALKSLESEGYILMDGRRIEVLRLPV